MKKLILFILICFAYSCSCPECETLPGPLRIIYLDSDANNLLENSELIVSAIINSNNGQNVEFSTKDFVVKDSVEKMHIEIISGQFLDQLINSEETFYIEFENGQRDTLLYGIAEIEGKCCSSYRDEIFIYNNDDLTGSQENTIGAYEIIKD